MIIEIDDIIDEVCEMYPTLEKSSIEKICRKGLFGIKKVLEAGDELVIKASAKNMIKFFIPMKPEEQRERTLYRAAVKKYKEEDERKDNK